MKLARFFFYIFLVFVPFGTRVLVYQFTTGFQEYEAVFIYFSDFTMVLFLVALGFYFYSKSKLKIQNAKIKITNQNSKLFTFYFLLFTFLVFSGLSIFWSWDGGLAIYNFGRLALLVLMALAVAKILKEGLIKLENIFAIIAGSAVLQSLIGFLQFLKQSSLGLGFLGESVLGPLIGGTAKIIVEGAPIMRAYGTLPHPNVLAAFLLLGLFSSHYLYLKYRHPMSIVGIFVISLGLVLTFSRTAWAIAIIFSVTILLFYLLKKEFRIQAIVLSAMLFSIFCFLVFGFSSFIFPRAQIATDEPAVSYRLAYNKLGLNLIKDK